MIRVALVDGAGIVTDVRMASAVSDIPGGVFCPEWVGVGHAIDKSDPTRNAQINAEADQRVDVIADPRLRERMMMLGLKITEKLASGIVLTAEEEEQRDAIKAIGLATEAVRAAADAAILSGEDPVWP